MSTRSYIGYEEKDIIYYVYCHWDGYPEHNGKLLVNYYNSLEKAKELVSLGDISILGNSIETTEDYHRREGEPIYISQKKLSNFYIDEVGFHPYTYLFGDGEWLCLDRSRNIIELDQFK